MTDCSCSLDWYQHKSSRCVNGNKTSGETLLLSTSYLNLRTSLRFHQDKPLNSRKCVFLPEQLNFTWFHDNETTLSDFIHFGKWSFTSNNWQRNLWTWITLHNTTHTPRRKATTTTRWVDSSTTQLIHCPVVAETWLNWKRFQRSFQGGPSICK